METGWFEILSLILNVVLGGGLIVTFITLKATKKEAEAKAEEAMAMAKARELENVDSAVKIWRELATSMSERQEKLAEQVEVLSTEVRRLKNATNRIVRLLDKMTSENMDEMIEAIKIEIEKEYEEHNDKSSAMFPDSFAGLQDCKEDCRSPTA